MTLRMRPTDRRRPLSSPVWASLALVAVLHACTCGSDKKTDGQVSTPEGDDQTSSVADPASLAPFLSPVGAEGAVPQQLVLEFARPVVKPEAVNRPAGPKTVLTWEPPVEGTTTFTRPSTLVFVPKNPFKYGARYAVTLSSVETSDGVVTTPAPDAWRFEFSTPPFAFLRVSAQSVDLAKAKVVADVVFAGPVDAGAVRRFLSWRVDGTPVGDVKLGPTDSPNTLRATLVSSKLNASATVELRVKEGLPSSVGGAKADAAGGSFPLFGGEPLSILNAHLKEGPSGFYVEVVCNDPQAEGGKRYYWDAEEDRSHELSRRCELQEAGAQQYIRFQPAVAFSTAPTGHGFRILGDFKRGSLQMKIGAGAGSVDGSVLLTAFEETFNVPARKPQARFAVGGRYLPRKAWKNLPISHLNLSEVELSVRQVPPENLVFWMSNERGERADERTSNLIVKKTVPLRGGPDAQTTSWVDVSSLVPASSQGLFELELKGKGASNAYARLLLTDINLVVKRASAPSGPASGGEVRAWALDMASGKPLSGVDVSLVRPSGQAVARCSTSGDEGCVLTPKADADTTAPFAVVARNGSDLTYLKFDELKAEVTDSDVRGEPYVAEVPYRASVYGDRGVYRPGETAHVTAIVRGKDNRAPPAKLPVTLQLLDPREKVLKRSPLATNEAGMVSHDVAFAGFADTGRYRAQLWVAERQVGEWSFNVEEFVPERMKVGVTLRGAAAPGAESPAEIEAAYLFGGSAAKSPVELTCRIEPAAFRPKENGQYLYGFQAGDGAETPKTITLGQVKGVLDEKGRAHLACPSAAAGGVPGALVASAAVFEAGSGRSTQNEGRAPFHPERFYLGLLTGTQKASANKAFTVEGLVVDWNGSLLPSAVQQVKVELFRLETEYGYFWDEGEGQERYQHHLRPVPEGVSTVAVKNGKFQVSATPAQSGEGYMVRVTAGNARTELRLKGEYSGHWYDEGGEGAVDRTPRPLKPKPVALQVPSLAKVGEAVDVKVKVPFAGYLLMTAETDRLLKSEWRKVSAGESAWSFTVPEFIPNAYVSAFLVKDPHLESAEAFIPDRAFGVASIPFEPTAFTRAVKLEAPDEVRSNAPLAVTLDLGKLDEPTYATVAVVDEGILSLTRFKSPEPFDALFAKRALGVDTFETVGWAMLLPPQGAAKNSGGDGSDGMASRVQPVKPVALWSGTVKVPESGKVTIPFKMPQYRGAVRVMAVTAGPNRIGRASKRVTVRDPLVLQTTLPRFLVQGDQVQIPVFLTNTSGSRQEVRVSLTAESLAVPGIQEVDAAPPAIKMAGKNEGRLTLEDGASGTVVFQATANRPVGAARFRVSAKAGGLESYETLEVPFAPSGPRERTVQRIELAAGDLDLKPYLQGWVPTSERSTFWVTANPYGDSLEHLKHLVHYPYGCIEQTTSSTRPLLYVSSFVGALDPSLLAGGKIEDAVAYGITRILSMQTPTGGFGYWPGSTDPQAWSTAYATHLLWDAQKMGYAVPADRLKDALGYLETWVSGSERGDREGYGDAEPYAHYVLALAGKGRKAQALSSLERIKNSRGKDQENAYLLKAALYLSGDRRFEKELKTPDVSPVSDERENSWSFYSDRRRRGLTLSIFQDLFGNDPAGEALAQRVADSLRGHTSGWYTTQELVWGITGLGKRVQGAAASFQAPKLVADGREIAAKAGAPGGKSDRQWALARAGERGTLQLKVADKGSGSLFLVLGSEGVRENGVFALGGNGLKLSRRFRTLAGDPVRVEDGSVQLADLVVVELTLTNTSVDRVQNIALVDRIPAGWEIENPRLGRGAPVGWAEADKLWNVDAMNVRDDRIELFGALERGETKTVVYAVRAVTSGRFTLPPAEAEAMYDPRVWAREAGGQVKVEGPWKDFLL